jgi:hypothetical protein
MPDLIDQLRRYADGAEHHVHVLDESTHALVPPTRDRSRRRLLAAAATIALLVVGSGALLLRDAEQVVTTPATPSTGECPASSDRAEVDDLRVALPFAASTDLILSTGQRTTLVVDRAGPREVQITVADFGVEAADPAANLPNGFPRTAVSLCDPFGGPAPTQLPAAIISSGDATGSGASLQFHPGGRWTVSLIAGEQSELTVEDLVAVAGGMTWAAPNPAATSCESVRGDGTQSLTVTYLPPDHQPESPPDATTVPAGATAAVEQYFRRDDGQTISVLWFSADDPASVIRAATGDLVDGQAEQLGIAGCLPVSGAYPGWRDGEIQVLVRRTPAGVIAAGQFGANDGWVVTGGTETTEAEVLAVASGLRP